MKKIVWQPRAKRQVKKIKERQTKAAILDAVETLAEFPNAQNVKALTRHKYTHRLRAGNYRILFNAFDAINIISVEEVKKRNERTYC